MIWKFTPFSTTKELGREYNSHCALVPSPDDWILIRDYDTMPLTDEAFIIMEKAIERYPDTGIFGCMTNRLGYSHQLNGCEISDNDSIMFHMKRAEDYARIYPNGECLDQYIHQVGGMFMLFKKSTWDQVKFIDSIVDDKGKNFDFRFCEAVKRLGLPLRIIQGIYIWHTYRLGKDQYDKSHLHGSNR